MTTPPPPVPPPGDAKAAMEAARALFGADDYYFSMHGHGSKRIGVEDVASALVAFASRARQGGKCDDCGSPTRADEPKRTDEVKAALLAFYEAAQSTAWPRGSDEEAARARVVASLLAPQGRGVALVGRDDVPWSSHEIVNRAEMAVEKGDDEHNRLARDIRGRYGRSFVRWLIEQGVDEAQRTARLVAPPAPGTGGAEPTALCIWCPHVIRGIAAHDAMLLHHEEKHADKLAEIRQRAVTNVTPRDTINGGDDARLRTAGAGAEPAARREQDAVPPPAPEVPDLREVDAADPRRDADRRDDPRPLVRGVQAGGPATVAPVVAPPPAEVVEPIAGVIAGDNPRNIACACCLRAERQVEAEPMIPRLGLKRVGLATVYLCAPCQREHHLGTGPTQPCNRESPRPLAEPPGTPAEVAPECRGCCGIPVRTRAGWECPVCDATWDAPRAPLAEPPGEAKGGTMAWSHEPPEAGSFVFVRERGEDDPGEVVLVERVYDGSVAVRRMGIEGTDHFARSHYEWSGPVTPNNQGGGS